MKDLICFLPVSVEKELPKEHGKQLCSQRKDMFIAVHFNKHTKEWRNGSFKKYPKVWLREFSLPELMEEALNDISINYQTFDEGIWHDPLTEKQYTTKELVNDFLKQKGIL